MEKNDVAKSKRRKNTGKIRIAFSAMIAFLLFLAEIYLMIHSSDYIEGLVTVTVLLLAVIYIFVTSIMQVNYEREQSYLDEIDDIFDSEKATYVLMRKSFDEINERLTFLEDNIKNPTEEIIAAQKAIAKVTISRNKENTDALMNSNDKMLDKIFSFEEMMVKNNDRLIQQQQSMLNQMSREIDLRLKEMELAVKNDLLQNGTAVPRESFHTEGEAAVDDLGFGDSEDMFDGQTDSFDLPEDSFEGTEEASVEEEPFGAVEEIAAEEEPVSAVEETVAEEEPVSAVEETAVEEEPIGAVEELAAEEEPIGAVEEIAAEEEPAGGVEEVAVEEEPVGSIEDVVADEELVGDTAVEVPEEESPKEEAVPMPDLSDPNKMMTPDEIAALLANL